MTLAGRLLQIVGIICCLHSYAAQTAHLYVSPTGSDQNDGKSLSTAFKTIAKSLSLLNNAEYQGKSVFIELTGCYHDLEHTLDITPHKASVFIELAGGYHDLDHTLDIRPHRASLVTIRSLHGAEVHVAGGKRVHSNQFMPVNDHGIISRLPASSQGHNKVRVSDHPWEIIEPMSTGPRLHYFSGMDRNKTFIRLKIHPTNKVRVLYLPDVGITSYPDLSPYGFGRGRTAPIEVFYNGIPLRLARWPNEIRVLYLSDVGNTSYPNLSPYGFWRDRTAPLEVFFNGIPLRLARWPNEEFINIVGTPDGQDGLRFQYNSSVNRPQSWTYEDNVWAYGYWYWSWADRSVKVSHIDAHAHTVTLAEKALYGLRTGHWNEPDASFSKQGGYFKFINVLAELDQPGEYYLDRSTGNLYVWMPQGDGSVGTSDVVYVSHLTDCINIHTGVHNVVLKDFTLEACRGKGIVANSARNIQILDMEVRNTGGYSIKFQGDNRDCLVARTLIHDGDGGISMSGGHRTTLESSGNLIEDTEIVDYSREGGVGYHGIALAGVGNLVRYNHIHRGQYTAVWYMGNDNIMEHNHIHHNCQNASDCGALHTGRDWTSRGNIIRYNIVHDTHRLVPGADVRGVMLDDQASGTIITNNVFFKNQVHVNIGGGRDNIVSNNVMYDADAYSMQVDGRGIKGTNNADLLRRLHAMPYNSSLWTSRYPPLAVFDSTNHGEPRGNQINDNLVYNSHGKEFVHGLSGSLHKDYLFNLTLNGFARGPVDFYDVLHEDYRVKCMAADWANHVGFVQPATINEVGPRYGVGPQYKRKARTTVNLASSAGACTTNAPAVHAPQPAYLPDGSRTNDIVNVPGHGCFLSITNCTDHPHSSHFYEDTYGEANENTGVNETACLARAAKQWRYCGSHKGDEITAVYGPTGAMTVAGDGCFFAMYGCPKHGGPTDGHVTSGKMTRDSYAEQHRNGSHDQEGCLSRARDQWVWCGSSPNHPVTSLYRPTGAIRTAGAGCWMHLLKCPNVPTIKTMFYDDWGATNKNTDASEEACFSRAQDFWESCGSDSRYPVTAYYRPHTKSSTYP